MKPITKSSKQLRQEYLERFLKTNKDATEEFYEAKSTMSNLAISSFYIKASKAIEGVIKETGEGVDINLDTSKMLLTSQVVASVSGLLPELSIINTVMVQFLGMVALRNKMGAKQYEAVTNNFIKEDNVSINFIKEDNVSIAECEQIILASFKELLSSLNEIADDYEESLLTGVTGEIDIRHITGGENDSDDDFPNDGDDDDDGGIDLDKIRNIFSFDSSDQLH